MNNGYNIQQDKWENSDIKMVKVSLYHVLYLTSTAQVYFILAQVALRAPPEVALQCVAGHC